MADNLCQRARRHFSDHIDDQPIPMLSRIHARLHLRICPDCKNVKRSLDATREALGALRDRDPEAGER